MTESYRKFWMVLNLTYFLNDRQVMIIRKEEKTQQEQKISINGTVRDAQQEHLPGVNVLVKGTTIGTTTDIDGNYFISVPDKNAVLVFSYIGFESQEVKVGGQININVNMSEESNSLDEVVVVGYGSQKRASVVGSITAIEPAQLQQGTTRAVSNNLAGQLAGVIAVQRNGEPGSDGRIFGFAVSLLLRGLVFRHWCWSMGLSVRWMTCRLPKSNRFPY